MYLNNINSPSDIKKLAPEQLETLAAEVRETLIQKLSDHGGHIGPNLGMVEATVAMHYVFNSPEDRIVFDVSHQSYAHKMLTGRKEGFLSPEHYDDVSGYTEPTESEHDQFVIGHTSTSISLALGLAKGRDAVGGSENVIAVIGDGSLSGGEALEGLNVAGEYAGNLIIVANDNQMSIAENHGGLYKSLQALRETNGASDKNLFKAMGLDYLYVAEGNNVGALVAAFQRVKDTKRPIVVHINTCKGKGFKPAEENKERFHWGMPFDRETGETKPQFVSQGESWDDIVSENLLAEMKADASVLTFTAGTPGVFGFNPSRRQRAGRQFVDVGIAEETAVAMISGAAKRGAKPVFGVVSSFVQRTYDQLSQDLCVNGSPATILVVYGSILGMNDVTHLGFFDIPLMANIPNLVYLAPTTKEEYLAMTHWAIHQTETPVAVRVPMGAIVSASQPVDTDYSGGVRFKTAHKGSRVAILGLGNFFHRGERVRQLLSERGIDATLINPRYASGVDEAALEALKADHELVVTLEDGCLEGGWGEKVARFYGDSQMLVLCRGAKKAFVDRYDYAQILEDYRLREDQIADDIVTMLG